ALRFGELREDRLVRFGEFVRGRAGQFDQPFAAAGKFVALLNLFFFAGDEIGRINLSDLMTKEVELLFARGFSGVERGVLGCERLQLSKMFSVFLELPFGAGERIEQVELLIG